MARKLVSVACRLRGGLVLTLLEDDRKVVLAGTVATVDPKTAPIVLSEDGSYAITRADPDFMADWLGCNQTFLPVRDGSIFLLDEAAAEAVEPAVPAKTDA